MTTYTGYENYSLEELEREIEAGVCIEFPVIVEMLNRISDLVPIAQTLAENGIDANDMKRYVAAVISLEIDTGCSPEEFKTLLAEKDREIENLTDEIETLNEERIEL